MMKLQDVLLKAMAKKITWWEAAEIIGVTDRTMRRWRERLEEGGYSGLADRRKGKPSEKRTGGSASRPPGFTALLPSQVATASTGGAGLSRPSWSGPGVSAQGASLQSLCSGQNQCRRGTRYVKTVVVVDREK
jgi:hypothetical protein